jgi:hypothetical protein
MATRGKKKTTKATAKPAKKASPKAKAPAPKAKKAAPKATKPAPAPKPAPAAKPVEPRAKIVLRPTSDGWVEVTYEGEGMFVHRDAGVFVRGTTTRLKAKIADQLRGTQGFRLAG